MKRLVFIFCWLMISCFEVYAVQQAPNIHGVNVITGRVEQLEPAVVEYEQFHPGINQTLDGTLLLSEDDFRVGRINAIYLTGPASPSDSIHFCYEPQATKVIDSSNRSKVYHYSESALITAVEHSQKEDSEEWFLTRCDRFIWAEEGAAPRLVSILVEDGAGKTVKCICFHYDSGDQLIKREEQIEGPRLRSTLIFDDRERLENLTRVNSEGTQIAESSFSYDESDNLILETHKAIAEGGTPREFHIRRLYDPSNRLVSIDEGDRENHKTTEYRYTQEGRLEQIVKPDGVVIEYIYNEEGLLREFRASNGSFDYVYEYDLFQRVTAVYDRIHDSVQRRNYHASGELIGELQSPGVKVDYHYDDEGRLSSLALPDGSQIAYHYQGVLLTAIDRLGPDKTIHYSHTCEHNEEGLLKAHHLLKGLGKINYTYGPKDRLAGVSSLWWSQRIEKGNFDEEGRILEMTVQDVRGEGSFHYAYTDEGQLVEEDGHSYAYDALYNRIGEDGKKWEVNSLNQLLKTPGYAFVYDANGNVVEKQSEEGTLFYSYDALDRMVRAECPEKFAFTYVYDAFHRRIEQHAWEWQGGQKKWSLKAAEKFVYDGFKEIGKTDGQGKLVQLRILGQGHGADVGAALALELNGRLFVPVHDIQGSVRCLVDAATGKAAESYSYTAFGEESIWDEKGEALEGSAIGNPWRYCSKRADGQTGLVFFGKRDYDPRIGRWMTPDPLSFCDTSNLYAFARNDPMNCTDLYGLYSISHLWDDLTNIIFTGFHYFQVSAHQAKIRLGAELKIPESVKHAFEKIGKTLFGESTYLLMGPHYEETHISDYGEHEISDKVRVTFINGILNTKTLLEEALSIVSKSHGGVKIHYVFRPTEGWTWDISRAIMIKTTFLFFGFRSLHAHLLAELWRSLIQEMGGIEGGGTIVHYAHSLGGSETDRARDLLSPEEQRMIRVVTFGSSTLVRNEGFQYVVNNISVNDGVSSFFLEPLGHIRNLFDPDSNVRYHGSHFFGSSPWWPGDHLLNGPTYGVLLNELGKEFISEFGPGEGIRLQ